MDVFFYGAGKIGLQAINVFKQYSGGDLFFRGYIETKKTVEQKNGYEIWDMNEVSRDAIVVITIANVNIVVDVYDRLREYGFKRIYFYYNFGYTNEVGKDFLKDYCQNCSAWGMEVLPHVEIHVSDYCNLNCRGCAHYSPIFEHHLPDTDSRIYDLQLLKEHVSHVVKLYLLGGEPFLNNDIETYICKAREFFPNTILSIVTNGLLIPQIANSVLTTIRENDVCVIISEYEPTKRFIDEIKAKLNANHVKYEIRTNEGKKIFNKPLTLKSDSKLTKRCISNGCINIYNGNISRCPNLMYIDQFNKVFETDLPNEGIYPLNGTYSGKDLKFMMRQEVPLCQYCVENPIEWGCCGSKPRLLDFVE